MTNDDKKIAKKLTAKKYYENNKEKIKQKVRIYSIENKDKISAYNKTSIRKEQNAQSLKKYYEKEENKIKKLIYQKEYEKRTSHSKIYRKNKRLSDPLFKLSTNIRSNINKSIKKNNYSKENNTIEILGCSYDFFKTYLENKFEPWMNWNNYGLYNGELNYGWDLDHIIPISSAKTEEDVIKLNHYTNFQPLCSHVNRNIKRANY